MARGRMIDKRVSNSKKLGKISDKARVLWFMIYPHLDKEARIAFDDLEDLKDEIIPKLKGWSLKKIGISLNELADIELIYLYPNKNKIAMEFVRFEDFQTGLRKDREAPSKIDSPEVAPENSGVFRISPALRLNLSLSIKEGRKEDKNNMSENIFDTLWKDWPKEGRFKRKICQQKFNALCKAGKLDRFKQTTKGYSEFLIHKREIDNFEQKVMHLATWMNNWEGEEETYKDFKYEPRL